MADTPTNPSRPPPPPPLLPHQMINNQNIPTSYIDGDGDDDDDDSDMFLPPPLLSIAHQIDATLRYDRELLYRIHAASFAAALLAQSAAGSEEEGGFSGDRGLPEEVITRFLETAAARAETDGGDHEPCAVCLEELHEEDRTVGVLRCRHRFHGDCIGKWLRRKNACPLCRAIVVERTTIS